jgi:pimeloyl-ACP methyl ester carboxylesterase
MTPSVRRRSSGLVVTAVVSLLLAACSEDGPEPTPVETSSPASPSSAESTAPSIGDESKALAPYYRQDLEWTSCRDDAQCTKVQVPLDYEEPRGERIRISVIRVPAEDEAKVGALLVNPGGPGASGIGYAENAEAYFGDPVRDNFDIVGFDPRGVGESAPIDCLSDEELDTFVASDPDPDGPAELAESEALVRKFGQGCLRRSGDLTRHVSTEEAARDLDIIRAALDQPRMLYFGASYGTFLGGTYADLFPDKVGRMVFDGAIDPTVPFVRWNLTQARSFETAIRAYVGYCVEAEGCPLEGSVDDGVKVIQDFLRDVDRQPLPTGTDRELTQGLAVLGLWAPLYNRDYWGLLDAGLAGALEGNGATLLQLADSYVSRGPDGYIDNSVEALYSVNCLDRDQWLEPDELLRVEKLFVRAAPTFGRVMAAGMTACGSWGVHSGERPGALEAEGSAPILVVGTSRDPATPLVWAEGLAEQLDNAVLVRRDGDGHTGYNAGNDCVDDVVESYLVAGEVPKRTVNC